MSVYQKEQDTGLIWRNIVMKVRDEIELSFYDGVKQIIAGEIGPWGELEERFNGIILKRVFSSLSPEKIDRLISIAEKRDEDYIAPKFSNFYLINSPPEHDPFEIAGVIASNWEESVEYAYVESLPAKSPATPVTDNPLVSDQAYFEPPNVGVGPIHIGGINVHGVWERDGSSGEGISFVDIERGWFLQHEDLEITPGNEIIPTVHDGINQDEFGHGTCVLGVLAAQDNGVGCVGIARNASGDVISIWNTPTTVDISNAIGVAADLLTTVGAPVVGNVMLLEVQLLRCEPRSATDPTLFFKRLPVETDRLNFEAIRLATAVGVVVVEAAGNGQWDANGNCNQPDPQPAGQADGIFLDDITDNLGARIFSPGHQDERDSGAILVASVDPFDLDATRLPSSNFGARIDCFAWGSGVAAPTMPNDSEFDTDGDGYTINFRGTSSAAAIVAGAALVMQSLAFFPQNGIRFEPFHLRQLMINTGTSPTDTTQGIGVMPNLQAFFDTELNTTPDIIIRDNLTDIGNPHAGPIANSPDIIVRPASGPDSVGNGVAAFGPTSSTMNTVPVGSTVTAGINHRVYVRARNRGGSEAANVHATVYYSRPSSLITPLDWNPIGTTATGTDVPVGLGTITVLDPIDWAAANLPPLNPDPNQNHYCFIATIGNVDDPDPIPDHTTLPGMTFDQFYQLIRNNNNVTWRNFNVVPLGMAAGAAMMVLPFWVRGAWDEARQMQLEIVSQLPPDFQVHFTGNDELVRELLKPETIDLKVDEEGRIMLPRHGSTRFNPAQFPKNYESLARLVVQAPPDPAPGEHLLFARQLYQGVEVGRISWLLVNHE